MQWKLLFYNYYFFFLPVVSLPLNIAVLPPTYSTHVTIITHTIRKDADEQKGKLCSNQER